MIGVAYDSSPESTVAVDAARALAAEQGAVLSAMTVVSVPTSSFGPGPLPLHDAIEAVRQPARDEIAALGGIEPHVAYEATAEELAVFSGRCDLLVMGSRGYGAWGRLVHGSTSRQLSRTARCPLLVLARAAERAGGGSDVLGDPDRARADREAAQAPGTTSAG
jgi:nucleotide-binding universal stress UspA family protein